MIKAVIFDMNGVIYDSTVWNWEARKQFLRSYGICLEDEKIALLVGRSLKDQLKWLKERYNLNFECDEFSRKLRALTVKIRPNPLEPNPGLQELVADLKKQGLKVGIAALFPKAFLLEDLESMGLSDQFLAISSLEDSEDRKDSPVLLLKETEKLGVKPQECVYIDDSTEGVQVAKSIQMKFIGKVTKFHKAKEFVEADLVVHSLEELNAEKVLGLKEKP